jgi:hypothetical protein
MSQDRNEFFLIALTLATASLLLDRMLWLIYLLPRIIIVGGLAEFCWAPCLTLRNVRSPPIRVGSFMPWLRGADIYFIR